MRDHYDAHLCDKALVTGGAGFIGSHVVWALLTRDVEVIVVDNFSSGKKANLPLRNDGLEAADADLKRDLKVLEDVISDPDILFHFAANPEVRVSTTHPRLHFEDNLVSTFNLLEAWRNHANCDRLVFASSSSVYGEPDNLPVSETDETRPVSVYGASKLACENLISTYSRLYGLKATILRYANIVGPRLCHGVVPDFVKKSLKDPQSLEVLGDGTQVRSYLHVTDAVEGTMIAAENTKILSILNVGNLDSLTVKDVAHVVTTILELKDIELRYCKEHGQVGWPGDVHRIVLDIDKLKKLGFEPSQSSAKAVEETARWIFHSLCPSARAKK